MKASKIEIENSVIRILENGPLAVSRKLEADAAKYADYTGQLVEDIHDEGLTAKALHAGMEIFRKNWTFQRWPVTGELLAFLKQGLAATEPHATLEKSADKPDPERWARQQMRSETGRQSLAQGWHYELWMWATRNPGKTPQDEDVQQMIEAEKIGRQRIGDVRANHSRMFCGSALLSIAECLDERKAKLLEQFKREWAA